jgi:glycosyltransferase involved in cell wall biosynthesis
MVKPKLSESSKIKLSVALATFNEERCLEDCLKSVKDLADEIVIVDGSSTDRTVEIAKSFGAKVIITDNKPIFHINKQQAMDECRGNWILQLDADEVVTPKLAEEIKAIINDKNQENLPSAYFIKRKKIFLGHWIKKGGHYPDPVIRFLKRGKAFLPCKSVHEQMKVEGEIGWLKEPMIHAPTPSFFVYVTKDNRYSSLMAKEMFDSGLKPSLYNFLKFFIFKPFSIFFSLFFRHKGFMDGFPGFVFAFYSALGWPTAYVKAWEMKQTGQVNLKKDWL